MKFKKSYVKKFKERIKNGRITEPKYIENVFKNSFSFSDKVVNFIIDLIFRGVIARLFGFVLFISIFPLVFVIVSVLEVKTFITNKRLYNRLK